MTAEKTCVKKKRITSVASSVTPGRLFFSWLSLFSMALMLKNSAVAIEYMKNGLGLCVKNVIPSLFPFMVLSELIVAFGACDRVGRFLRVPMRKLFGVSGQGSVAVILGALCGFPVGAKTAVRLYDSGSISRKECEHLLTFSNYPSSAFVISAVGVSLYQEHTLGVLLWVLTICSSAVVGIIMRRAVYGKTMRSEIPDKVFEDKTKLPGVSAFTSAVTSSAISMLYVCAYVVFFAALIGALGSILEGMGFGKFFGAVMYSVFEISSGVSAAAGIPYKTVGLLICAFALGWSGISVHCQIMSICDGRGLSFKPYFTAKILQGVLNTLILAFLLICFPSLFAGIGIGFEV